MSDFADGEDYVQDESRLKIMQLHADLANKVADTAYKQGLLKYEPWKVMASVMVATAAVFGVLGAILGYTIRGTH